jgi:CxxC motif-containing protein (DUF1111 family)
MRLCVIAIVIAIAAAAGCSGKPPPPVQVTEPAPVADAAVALDQDLPRLVERSLAMYRDVAKALADNPEDCGAAAGKLGQLAGVYREVVTANAKVLHDGRAKQLKAALEPHGEAFDRSAQAIMHSPALARCAQEPAFATAIDELLEAPP